MKQKTTLTRSRWLFACLLSLLMTLGGASPAWAQQALPYSYGFEDADEMTNWTLTSCKDNSSGYGTGRYMGYSNSGSYSFRFYYNDNPPQYLISPEFATSANSVDLSFWYKTYGSYGPETFQVGYSTTTNDVSSFTWDQEVSTSTTTYTQYVKTYPAGTKYIAIRYNSNDKYYLYIDDFSVSETEAFPKPTDFSFTGYTSTTASFSWTNGGEETAWQIAYSTTQGFDAGSVSPVNVTTNPYTLEGLTAETTYYARIRADYGSGNYSNWSDEISFKPSAATAITINDGSATNAQVPFYCNYTDTEGTMSQFIIPSATLTDVQERQITKIAFYNGTNKDFGNARYDVYMKETTATSFDNTTFDWTDMEKVATSTTVNIVDGKMEIVLDVPFDYSSDNLMIGFNIVTTGGYVSSSWVGVSATSAAISSYKSYGSPYPSIQNFLPKMTITSLPGTPVAVKKPKNLAASATATTTATLGWTDGEDGLTEWQIAYSTDTDFNPDSEGTKVAADANPFTLTELTAATTYYAYVRAKKEEDYSGWSNKAEFTTLSALPIIELSTTSHNFGMVSDADAQALTLTISNTGGAALTGLTVTPTNGFAVTDMEGNDLTTTTIAASSTLSVKVKMSALGQQNGTITIDGNEIDEQVVNVSGYMLDDTKICETFANASSVSRWTVASGWTFNASTGAYSGNSERTMTTPKISVGEGNVLALNVKLGWSGGSLIVEGSEDNGDSWTAFDAKTYNSSNGGLNTSSYTLITIDDIPTTVNKIRLTGYYAYINVFNGFTYVNDPQVGFFSNEACTSVQASPATKNFGFATEAQNQTYYVKNTGNGQVDLTIDAPSGFTATVNDGGEALTENEVATLTITMPATEGLHDGTITITAKNHDDDSVLGTFLVNANGGITGTKNNVVLTAFPAGWQNNNWAINSGAARIWSSTPSDLITTTLRVAAGDKLLVDAKKYYNSDDSQLSYSYSANNGTSWSDPVSLTSSLGTDYKIVAISGIPEGDVLMKFTGTYAYIRQIYGFEAVAEPIMEFAADGTTKNFGMITAKTTSDAYTITNSGTALLENLSVTCNNDNFEIAVADDANSIAAGSNVTFTVALKTTALGLQSGTVTIAGTGVESKTLNVKGYVADNTKIFTTFAALPDRWTNASNYWTFSANGASATSSSSKLETPKIIVAEGQKLAISAKLQYSGSYYVTINGSSDNGATWTAYTKTLNNAQLNNTDYTVVELDDVPTTVNKLQLVGYYVYVNGLNGFTYDDNDPEFSLFSDEGCNTPIAAETVTNAWGFVNEDKTATYYIKNTGTGTLTLSKTDAPAGMTATLGKTSLAANEITSLVISMENDTENNEGYHGGDVVLTGKNSASETLGTFTVTSSGVVVGSKTDINFTTLSTFPAGWDGGSYWSVTANTKATVGWNTGTLTTGTYSVAAGEKLAMEVSSPYPASGSFTYEYSTDGGSSWTDGTSTIMPTSTSYALVAITDVPASSNVKIKFTGKYIDIRRIYGYTAVLEPVMTLSPAATNHDFGMQTAAANYEITVTNSGTAEMTGVTAELAGTDAADYQVVMSIPDGSSATISENVATIPVGQTLKVTATLKVSTQYKEHNATLTISADGLADKVITLTGKTRDASKWYVDFASEIPASFVEKGSWSVSSGAAYSGSGESSLITQPINLATGEKIYFDAKKPSYGSPSLQVRYSVNGGISWSEYVDYTAAISSTSTYSSHEIDLENASAVTAIIEFKGYYYMYIDNVYGGTLNNTASMIKVTKSAAVVESGTTEAFGSINAEATATYTITNVGNGTLTITDPVTKTGAATVTVNKTSLANGESATLIITMPVEAPYGEKSGAVTVETNLGNFVINYNATILNPNALDEQFTSGKPAGWYFGGYWEVNSQRAENTTSGVADRITEQLTECGESDVLTCQAAKTGSRADTFNVYTSQDRVTWNAVDLGELTLTTSYQDVNISGLAAGDYYVKITGARVKVDNFLGWTKKYNTRDLYVTATSFPATTTKGNNATITATVTSLIADETDVYAKLFFDETVVATADAEDIAKNGTKTFSFTYAIPENKTAQIKVYYSNGDEAFVTAENAMKVNYTMSETPGDPIDPIVAGTYNVTLNREFSAGWNTVCVPFAISNVTEFFGDGAHAYAFNNYDGNIQFATVDALAAGTPYLVYVESAFSEKDVEDAVVTTDISNVTKNGVTFTGTYAPMGTGSLNGKFGVSKDNRIAKGNANTTMKGFRAYFDGSITTGARIAIIDEATGITRVYAPADIFGDNDRVYNMSGQKVENAKKGVYIVNGRKVVVK